MGYGALPEKSPTGRQESIELSWLVERPELLDGY